MNENTGYKLWKNKEDRKYRSIVDEYRRYYVTGKTIRFGGKGKTKEIFEQALKVLFNSLTRTKKMDMDKLHSGYKLGSFSEIKNLEIIWFEKDKEIILQHTDPRENIYRIIIKAPHPEKNILIYEEWVKKSTFFFGLSDQLQKMWMWTGARRKAKLLKNYINFNVFGKGERVKLAKEGVKTNINENFAKSAFFSRKESTFVNADLAAKYDKSIIAPDEMFRHNKDKAKNAKLKEAELEAAKKDDKGDK